MNTATAKTTSEPRALAIAAITISLAAGEDYAGAVLNDDGTVHHHVVLLPDEIVANHDDATAWAAKQGGVLPELREQSLLFTNLKSKFKPRAYWSSETYGARNAYFQDFFDGYQSYNDKGAELPARAVRRVFP